MTGLEFVGTATADHAVDDENRIAKPSGTQSGERFVECVEVQGEQVVERVRLIELDVPPTDTVNELRLPLTQQGALQRLELKSLEQRFRQLTGRDVR